MATIAKIKCFSCNRKFDYYFNLRKPGDEIMCPFCYAQMDESAKRSVIEAIAQHSDSNMDFRKHAQDRNEPLFQFDLLEIGD